MNKDIEHIDVCVLTYKRPVLLEKLLLHLMNQLTLDLFSYSIIVVDNDANQTASALTKRLSNQSPIDISYWCEPNQNIALARNAAVLRSTGDYIAFIDDDEIPAKDWLLILHKSIHFFDCDGIQGPVLPYYDGACPQWAIRARFYDRPIHKNGMVLKWKQGRTGNLLLKRSIFDNRACLFDANFGSGAEDQDFFRRAIEKGYQFRYSREAVAHEYVPAIRCKPAFLIRRALLRGKVSITHPDFHIKNTAKSAVAIPFYFLSLPVLLLLGQHYFMLYLTKTFDHIGKCLSLLKINLINDIYVTG